MADITCDLTVSGRQIADALEGLPVEVVVEPGVAKSPRTGGWLAVIEGTVQSPGKVTAAILGRVPGFGQPGLPEGTVEGRACKHCLFDIWPDPRGWRLGFGDDMDPWACEDSDGGHEPATEAEMQAMVRGGHAEPCGGCGAPLQPGQPCDDCEGIVRLAITRDDLLLLAGWVNAHLAGDDSDPQFVTRALIAAYAAARPRATRS